ncbi:MAG: hypothetical protein R2798_05950 [Chitinophagales bacterium]
MKIVDDLNLANKLLKSYIGAIFQVAFYNESLRRIAIRIYFPELKYVVYFIGVGCESISGNFWLSNTDLSITTQVDEETKEKIIKLIDKISGFELSTSGGFSLVQGLESEFGTSFDNFIKEK